MKIIILGAGQVGATLAENLTSEENEITVVDIDAGNALVDRIKPLARATHRPSIALLCTELKARLDEQSQAHRVRLIVIVRPTGSR